MKTTKTKNFINKKRFNLQNFRWKLTLLTRVDFLSLFRCKIKN